jgi:secreted trypsin-like serine protease
LSGISPDLKFVDLNIISNEECAEYFGLVINANMMCIETNNGAVAACDGDFGGPMVITEADGLPTEIGVASFGSAFGCESRAPVIFARITKYLDWLETNAGVTIRP